MNFPDMLWRVFVTGLLATIVSLGIKFFYYVFQDNAVSKNPLIINLLYHINAGLIIAFLTSTFIVWKRLILYQKTKALLLGWTYFEYCLAGFILFDLFYFSLGNLIFYILLLIGLIFGLTLSFNLKWVAYLNFRQKWRSLLFIILLVIYLIYFIDGILNPIGKDHLMLDLANHLFVLSLAGFIFIYSITSFLVVLFNLPTSSVFEGKLQEIINFQRLSQSAPKGKTENEIYEILLDSSLSAVFTNSGWVEVMDEKREKTVLITKNIEKHSILNIKNAIRSNFLKNVLRFEASEYRTRISNLIENLKRLHYRGIIIYPIFSKNTQVAYMALVSEVEDSFNREMLDILKTFINQASISVENLRLIQDALENERYQEELKIASKVQESLLPVEKINNDYFHLTGMSITADEVGGDYYDYFSLSDERFAVIMADVSGKGTSAAFHMSQMKGIFHSLVQLLDPKKFIVQANDALSRCLDKSSFVTVSYLIIDCFDKTVQFARAGHCPTLYYNNITSQTVYYKNKGLGLGILRNSNFNKYVQVNELTYLPGDILVLYTDGIVEATNDENEQFGYVRLEESVKRHANLGAQEIQDEILNDLHTFCAKSKIDDDYTLLVIRFKS